MPPAGQTAAKAAPAAKPAAKKGPIKVTLTDSDVETPRENAPRPKPAPKRTALPQSDDDEPIAPAAAPAHKLSTTKRISNPLGDDGAVATESGDSDDDAGFLRRPAAKPSTKPAAKPSAAPAGALFDNDSDSEPPKAPSFKPAAKATRTNTAALFGSGSDSESTTPRPKPAAKPGAKPGGKVARPANSDSD